MAYLPSCFVPPCCTSVGSHALKGWGSVVTCPRPVRVTGQNKKEEKAWNARCKKGDKELRAAGKQLDAARIHAAKLSVGGGTGRLGLEAAPTTPAASSGGERRCKQDLGMGVRACSEARTVCLQIWGLQT